MDDILKNQEILKEQVAEIGRLLQMKEERNKKLKELEEYEAECQRQIKEKEAKLLWQKQMIEFQNAILTELGLYEFCVDTTAM